jgi:hypothetical protein
MKRGNIRTVKIYSDEGGKKRIQYALQGRKNGVWLQAVNGKKKYIFDLEYDACAQLLAFEEHRKGYI